MFTGNLVTNSKKVEASKIFNQKRQDYGAHGREMCSLVSQGLSLDEEV